MARIDKVLEEAVDEFPRCSISRPRTQTRALPQIRVQRRRRPKLPGSLMIHPRAHPTTNTRWLAAERMEWSRKMHEKGYVSKSQHDLNVRTYELLKAQIEADIARGTDRVEWAKRMFEKGYLTKTKYDAEVLKHYDALKARLGDSEAMSDAVLERYELLKRQLLERAPHTGSKGDPGTAAPDSGEESAAGTRMRIRGNQARRMGPGRNPGNQARGLGPGRNPGNRARRLGPGRNRGIKLAGRVR